MKRELAMHYTKPVTYKMFLADNTCISKNYPQDVRYYEEGDFAYVEFSSKDIYENSLDVIATEASLDIFYEFEPVKIYGKALAVAPGVFCAETRNQKDSIVKNIKLPCRIESVEVSFEDGKVIICMRKASEAPVNVVWTTKE